MFANASGFTVINSNFIVVSNNERKKIQEWLNAPDCTINFQVADDKRTEGTGKWILSHPEYMKWKQSPSVLWVQGKAGSGKTVLSTTIIRDLEQEAPENVWYHYFDSRDNTNQKSTFRGYLLSLLLWVGADRSGKVHPALKALFDKCSRQGLTSGSSPTEKDLAMVLKEVLVTFNWGYIVLDAMDECSDSKKVLGWLQNFPKQFCILFTSRYSSEGDTSKNCLKISLDSRNAQIDNDIGIYLEEKIEITGDLRAEVINSLKEKAQGQFRWVDCQLRALEDCGGLPGAVREALADLPEDLEQTYNQAMEQTLKKRTKQYAHHVLLWLLYSFKPLTVSIIQEILAVNPKNSRVEKVDGMKVQINGIIDSTLVAIDTYSNVQLAHASVKEFLITQYNSSHAVGLLTIDEQLAHEHIAQTCIVYLMEILDKNDVEDKTFHKWPIDLGSYAVQFWTTHTRLVEGKDNESQLHLKIVEFATIGVLSFQRWAEIFERFWNCSWKEDVWKNASPTFYLIWEGLLQASDQILNAYPESDLKGALYVASRHCHADLVLKLLSCGADVNAQGGSYGNALQAAAALGNEGIVNVLLENGADVNAQGGQYGNALQAAVAAKNEGIVNVLLEKGAHVNAQGGQYSNALQAAVAAKNESIVNVLLENGADVNAQ
ncbi:hypothetical protein GYMLUDRAFT_242835, partial [Collybiopsis luxurians FD-317 M1]